MNQPKSGKDKDSVPQSVYRDAMHAARFAWMTFVATPLWLLSWAAALLLALTIGRWAIDDQPIDQTWLVDVPTWTVALFWIIAGAAAKAIARNEQDLQRREQSGF